MPDDRSDPLADLFTMFAMPVSGTLRSVEQFRKGVDEFLVGVENFNRTMANLNETTERINALLADVEEPIRAAVPQVTRTVKAADEMMQVVSGPAMAVAPGLAKLAETLNTPAFAQLPAQIGQFSELLGEVSRRLAPLAQVAESAGGLFGLRVPGMRGPQRPEASSAAASTSPTVKATRIVQTAPAEPEVDVDDEVAEEPAPKQAPAETASPATKASPAKKKAPAKKKSPAKKKASAKKRAPAKKAPSKKKSSAKAASPAKKAAVSSSSSASSTTGSDE